MKELEKIEKVLFQNQHILHYPDEYKSVAKKIYKLFAELEKERDYSKAMLIDQIKKKKGISKRYGELIKELLALKEEVRKYIYQKEDNYPKLKELIK